MTQLGALDENEILTPLGFHLAKLPVGNIRIGKMLIYGSLLRCASPVLDIAAILSCKNPFVAPIGKFVFANWSFCRTMKEIFERNL